MSSSGGCGEVSENATEAEEEMRRQMEQKREVDSPLGPLDPCRITHMVVDRDGLAGPPMRLDNKGFMVPGPPCQQWSHASPVSKPSVMSPASRVMDDCGHLQPRMGTPSSLMHMQQGAVGSPSVCSAPMVQHHQQQHQQQGVMQDQPTSAGQFERSAGFILQQQVTQGYTQGVVHVQQQMMVTECDASTGMYDRQQHMMGPQQQHQLQIVCRQQQQLQQQQQQQRMMGQQQPIMCQQMMVPQHVGMMGSNPQQHYQQQSLQAHWTQQQQQAQQANFARQPQMMGAAPPQRVMLQRVPYPQGTGMILFESRLSL